MKRRAFLCGLAAGIVLASPALAADVVKSIIRQLRKLGFSEIAQERTLLGRVRITAARQDGRREIIVNPKTGELLRDLWIPNSGQGGALTIIDDRERRSDRDKGDDGDDGDDHDDDRDDDKSDKGGDDD